MPSDAFYDAVVVVAGGMTDSGGLPPWVVSRLDHAVDEYRRHVTATPPKKMYVVLSGSATPHKPPPLQKGGFTLHESTAMAEYVVAAGVPPQAVLKDTASMDTIGNAYYSLTLHAAPRNWRRVQVVTSEFHARSNEGGVRVGVGALVPGFERRRRRRGAPTTGR